jgi:hypothetical protein
LLLSKILSFLDQLGILTWRFSQIKYQKSGVAETKYEFNCRDVPWKVSARV